MSPEIQEKWTRIERSLRAAQAALPPLQPKIKKKDPRELVGDLDEFREFMDQREWELAWDALSSLAIQHQISGPFWVPMAEAAELMKLEERRLTALNLQTPELVSKNE